MTPPKTARKKAPAKTSGVSVKIPRHAYAIAKRIAKREQRNINTAIERALVQYEAGFVPHAGEGGSK